ncbi:PAS domain S-box protein [Lyngbya aestuarii]|uniref:PAS domain S-box protein n=1 Tax=Lyngbya aestuarii TaxID=118322 RepID=UPI00403D8C43
MPNDLKVLSAMALTPTELQLFFDSFPEQLYVFNRARRLIFANRVFLESISNILGRSQPLALSDVVGKTVDQLGLSSEFTKIHEQQLENVFSSGKSLTGECSSRSPSGTKYYQYKFTPIGDISEVPQKIVVTYREITEYQQLPLADKGADFSLTIKEEQPTVPFQESQQHLSAVLAHAPVALYAIDSNGIFTLSEGKERNSMGLEPTQVIGKSVFELYSNRSDCLEHIKRALLGSKQTWSASYGEKIFESRVTPLKDSKGNVLGIVGVSCDITSEQQVHNSLIESEEKFRQMTENIRECFWMSDANRTELLYISPAYEQLWGRSRQSAYECMDTRLDAIYPEDQERIRRSFARVLLGETVEEEYRVVRPDGSLVWLLDRTFPVWNSQGEVYRLAGIVVDISERKQAEEELKKQKEILQTIFDHIPVMISFFDAQGKMQLMSRELENCLGWSLSEIQEVDILKECYPDPEYRQMVLNHMLKGAPGWQDLQTRIRNGQVLETSWANVRLSDGTSIGIGQDITFRKQAERQLLEKAQELEKTLHELQKAQAQLVQNEKMSSLGQLMAGVAHEINNPVGFISGNVSFAEDYAESLIELVELYQEYYPTPVAEISQAIEEINLNFIKDDFIKLLKSMEEGAKRIREIVLQLRNFSRLDEGEMKPIDLHSGIESTLLILQHRLKEKPERRAIKVVKEFAELPWVECYASQLNQVFMNILSNAIDAVEEKLEADWVFTPEIRISTAVEVRENCPLAVIRISDNGLGISTDAKQRLFDPFFTTKPIGKGTGLGLSISHQIVVERHQGQLLVTSEPGQGTKFLIKIPLKD